MHLNKVIIGESVSGNVTVGGKCYKYEVYMFELTTLMLGNKVIFDDDIRGLILSAWLNEFDPTMKSLAV